MKPRFGSTIDRFSRTHLNASIHPILFLYIKYAIIIVADCDLPIMQWINIFLRFVLLLLLSIFTNHLIYIIIPLQNTSNSMFFSGLSETL